MNYEAIRECTILSDEAKISFPEVVQRLIQVEVISYYADLIASTKTYYTDTQATTLESKKYPGDIAENFDAAAVVDAIRRSQAGHGTYQEFVTDIMKAGVFGYIVFLTGKKVIYFGKKGEQHIENFPNK